MEKVQIKIIANERGVRKVSIPAGTAADQGRAISLATAILKNLQAINEVFRGRGALPSDRSRESRDPGDWPA